VSGVTVKGQVLAEIIKANPRGRLKVVEYDSYGGIRRIEWHEDYTEAEPAHPAPSPEISPEEQAKLEEQLRQAYMAGVSDGFAQGVAIASQSDTPEVSSEGRA
jgi:hypothetical protein